MYNKYIIFYIIITINWEKNRDGSKKGWERKSSERNKRERIVKKGKRKWRENIERKRDDS